MYVQLKLKGGVGDKWLGRATVGTKDKSGIENHDEIILEGETMETDINLQDGHELYVRWMERPVVYDKEQHAAVPADLTPDDPLIDPSLPRPEHPIYNPQDGLSDSAKTEYGKAPATGPMPEPDQKEKERRAKLDKEQAEGEAKEKAQKTTGDRETLEGQRHEYYKSEKTAPANETPEQRKEREEREHCEELARKDAEKEGKSTPQKDEGGKKEAEMAAQKKADDKKPGIQGKEHSPESGKMDTTGSGVAAGSSKDSMMPNSLKK